MTEELHEELKVVIKNGLDPEAAAKEQADLERKAAERFEQNEKREALEKKREQAEARARADEARKEVRAAVLRSEGKQANLDEVFSAIDAAAPQPGEGSW